MKRVRRVTITVTTDEPKELYLNELRQLVGEIGDVYSENGDEVEITEQSFFKIGDEIVTITED